MTGSTFLPDGVCGPQPAGQAQPDAHGKVEALDTGEHPERGRKDKGDVDPDPRGLSSLLGPTATGELAQCQEGNR